MNEPLKQSDTIAHVGSLYRDDLVRIEELARTSSGYVRTSWSVRFLGDTEFDAEDVDRLVAESERRGLEAKSIVWLKLHLLDMPPVIFDDSVYPKGIVKLGLSHPHAEWEKSEALDAGVRAVAAYVLENEGTFRVSFRTRDWARRQDEAAARQVNNFVRTRQSIAMPEISLDDPPRSSPHASDPPSARARASRWHGIFDNTVANVIGGVVTVGVLALIAYGYTKRSAVGNALTSMWHSVT